MQVKRQKMSDDFDSFSKASSPIPVDESKPLKALRTVRIFGTRLSPLHLTDVFAITRALRHTCPSMSFVAGCIRIMMT